MNSLKGEGVPLLNFVGGPGTPLLNFEGGLGVPLLNFRGSRVPLLNFEGGPGFQGSEVPVPGVLVSLLHHALEKFKCSCNLCVTKVITI